MPNLCGLREWYVPPWNNGWENGSFSVQVSTLFTFITYLFLVKSLVKYVTHVLGKKYPTEKVNLSQ